MNASDFISRAREIVLENLLNPQFGVEMLARELGISRSELYKRIKRFENKSASQFIREIRLEKALELLKTDSYSIGEIAYMVGFHSPTYFSTSFKEYYGYSPSSSKEKDLKPVIKTKAPQGRRTVPLVLGGILILALVFWSLSALQGSQRASESVDLSVDRQTSLEAYRLYLEAQDLVEQRKDSAFPIAVELLEKAIELDPSFAEAYAEMSYLYGQWHYYGSLKKADRDKMMKKYMDLAMHLDSLSPEVLFAKADLGWRNFSYPEDTTEILTAFQRVLDKDQYNDRANYRLSLIYRAMGQFEISHSHLEKASALEPENYHYKTILARDLFWKIGDRKRSVEIIDDVIKNSKMPGGVYFRSLFLAESSRNGHVQAFKSLHTALKEHPYLYGYLYWNTLISLDLDLLPLSKRYSALIQTRYPENTIYTYENAFNLLISEQRYDAAIDLTIIWKSNKGLNDQLAIANLARAYFLKGDLEKAEQIQLEYFGDLFEKIAIGELNPKSFSSIYLRPIRIQIDVLRRMGKSEEAGYLADFLCSYYREFHARAFFAKKFDQIDCLYLQNDLHGFVNALREAFFSEGNRLGVFRNLRTSRYPGFENEPEYQQLFREIEKETHRMRAQVIDYLKAENEWDPAWDKELNLAEEKVALR